ncbi:MAG: hypothetical protein ACI9TO_000884 [Rickettsiales bacterium]|jgi:hypothetical protein
MITSNNNEVLFKKSFNISHKLENLISNFDFCTDPKDGIKDVRINGIKVVSTCENYDFYFTVSDDSKTLLDTIREKNISIDYPVVKEIDLSVIFYEGFLDKRKQRISVKVKYFDHSEVATTNPIINKYLENWGLVQEQNTY